MRELRVKSISVRRRILLVLLGIALPIASVVLVEIGLRILRPNAGGARAVKFEGGFADDAVLTLFDRDLLFRLAPNADLLGYYQTNSQGYRGREPGPKRPGTLRVACVGDSCTFGLGVRADRTWPAQLEAMLRVFFDHDGDRRGADVERVECINFGVPGYSSFQNRRQIELEVDRCEPDIVVWMPVGYNDALLARAGSDSELSDRFHSLAYRISELRILRAFMGEPPPPTGEGATLAAREGGRPRVAVDDLVKNVAAAREATQSKGRDLVIVIPPLTKLLESGDATIGNRRQSLVDFVTENGVAYIDPGKDFERLQPYALHVDPIHPSAEGQRRIALSVLEVIAARHAETRDPLRLAHAMFRWLEGDTSGYLRFLDAATSPGSPLRKRAAVGDEAVDLALDYPDSSGWREDSDSGRIGYFAAKQPDGAIRDEALARRTELLANVLPATALERLLFGEQRVVEPVSSWSDRERASWASIAAAYADAIGYPGPRVDLRAARALVDPDVVGALERVQPAIDLSPNEFFPRYVKAKLLASSGRDEEALSAITRLVAEFPDEPRALVLQGLIAVRRAKVADARLALEKGLAFDPVAVEGHYAMARIALYEGEFDEAVMHLNAVKAINISMFPDVATLLERAKKGERLERVNR